MPTHRRSLILAAAALSAAVTAFPARAQQQQTGDIATGARSPDEEATDVTPGNEPDDRGLLMQGLDRAGIGTTLDDARVRVSGYVEGSYTYNPDPTDAGTFGDINLDRLFDFESGELLLNQLNLTVERPVRLSSDQWDVGFRTEVIYGADSRWLQANGLDFYGTALQTDTGFQLQPDPENQFALFQAYVDFGVPVGEGLRLRVGKFASFFGGTVDPNLNSFYSRSLMFSTTHPLALTGVLATYSPTERMTFDVGFSRGWEQALEDNNAAIDVLGRVGYVLDAKTGLTLAAITGPEQDDNNSDYRTLVEATLIHRATDRLRLYFTGTYGHEAHFQNEGDPFDPTDDVDIRDARWYAVTGLTNYTITRGLVFSTRLEYLRDEKGFVTGEAGSVVSGTLGLSVTPFVNDRVWKNFKVRPEVRLDWSPDTRYGEDLADLDSHDQLTVAVDAIFTF